MTDRYYIDTEGPDDDAIRLGLVWLAENARSAGEGTLHAPGLDNLRSLSPVIANIEAIIKNKVFTLNDAQVNVATPRTGHVRGAVLALWTDAKVLPKSKTAGCQQLFARFRGCEKTSASGLGHLDLLICEGPSSARGFG